MDLNKLEEKIKEDLAYYLLDADWPFPKNIKAEFPQSPHIIIKNDFNKSINVLAKKLIKKINKIIKL